MSRGRDLKAVVIAGALIGGAGLWWRRSAPIDMQAALRYVGGDRDLLAELARVFLEELPRYHAGLETALASGRPERMADAAHRTKGALAALGASRGRTLAERLEGRARDGSLVGAPELTRQLRVEIGRVGAFLRLAPGSGWRPTSAREARPRLPTASARSAGSGSWRGRGTASPRVGAAQRSVVAE